MEREVAIRLEDITKIFAKVVANSHVNLEVYRGEILSLLGENGSGKTTLVNMLSGIYFPDGGKIYVNGKEVMIRSPKDAFDLGIGMIHQHFKLVDILTAAENVALGLKEKGGMISARWRSGSRRLAKSMGSALTQIKKSMRCRSLRSKPWRSSKCCIAAPIF